MKFARSIACLLILSLGTSCISDADAKRMGDAVTQTILQTTAFSALAVRYREQNGGWPTDPKDLCAQPDVPSDIDLRSFCDRVKVTSTARGLLVSEKASGQTLFVIGNESSTKNGVVLVGETAGG
jgi:hypothetical protein